MKKIIIFFLFMLCLGCSSTSSENRNSKISKYFTLEESIRSNVALKYKIKNNPSNAEYKNIIYTAKRMDEVRKALKTKIYVTSWFRSEKVNKKVGGSKNSYHLKGLAVDFKTDGKAKDIKKKLDRAKISYDQLIYYPNQNRVHISFRESKRKERKQYFLIK